MTGNLSLLAGGFGLETVRPLRQLYNKPENATTKELLDEYFAFHKLKYGRVTPPPAEPSTEPSTFAEPKKKSKKEEFLRTLKDNKRPDFNELDFEESERINVFTLWYSCQLMKL